MAFVRRLLQKTLTQYKLLILIGVGMIPVLLIAFLLKPVDDPRAGNLNDHRNSSSQQQSNQLGSKNNIGVSADDRNPASFEEISDSDVPARTIYSSTRIDSPTQSQGAADRGLNRRLRQPLSAIQFATKEERARNSAHALSSIEFRLGLVARRARAVKFDAAVLEELKQREPGEEYLLPLELFPDFERMIRLKVISGFEVNKGLHSGVIEGDATSKVQLAIEGQAVSAFIESRHGRFRIIYDPMARQYFVVELK